MEPKTRDDGWTEQRLIETGSAYWGSCTLHAGVKLGLFGPLADQALTADELADQLRCDARALAMLLRALAAMGLLEKDGDRYRATEFSARRLAPASSDYLGHILLHHQHLVSSWERLAESVVSGLPARDPAEPMDDEWRQAFLLGMFNLARLNAPRLVPQIDLGGRRRLLDLGGGPGTYAAEFCRAYPQLSATVFDLPASRPYFEETIRRYGLEERVDFIAGDFLADPLPDGYDVVWLSHVLHGEGPDQCRSMLRKAVSALEPGGLVLVHEFILDDERPGPVFPALFSLNMLLGTTAGQAYSFGELAGMLTEVGVERVKNLALVGGPSAVMAGTLR